MENFDAIVVVIGVALIIAGLALFITGKVVSQNNQIEAFGVKINFNNPSFMLVVAGIGMVLVPRILPDPTRIQDLPPPAAGIPADAKDSQTSVGALVFEERVQERPGVLDADTAPPQAAPPAPENRAPSMAGNYELLSYTINNIPQIVEGTMQIEPDGGNRYQWHTQFDSYDFYGNYLNLAYQGALDFTGNAWLLDVNASNDPTWMDAGKVETQVMQEGELMGFSYIYNGNYINSVWEKE